VIVIEAVAEPQKQAGAERGFEFPIAQELYHKGKYMSEPARAQIGAIA
jgi:hypothetical protein